MLGLARIGADHDVEIALDNAAQAAGAALAGKDLVQLLGDLALIELHRLQIEGFLVAEAGIEARTVDAGRLDQVVERGRGKALHPKDFQCLFQHHFGIVGARPAALAYCSTGGGIHGLAATYVRAEVETCVVLGVQGLHENSTPRSSPC